MKPVVFAKQTDYDPELHKGRIGSSMISAIAGLNDFCSPLKAYYLIRGEMPADPENMHTRMGKKLEPVVAELFCEETGFKVRNPHAIYCHPQNKTFIATPDRLVVGRQAVLECKTGDKFQGKHWTNSDIPASYEAQVRWQAYILGLEEMYIAALLGGNNFIWQRLEHDPEIAAYLLKIAEDFMGLVESGTPPAPIWRDGDILKTVYPKAEPISVVLPESIDSKRLADLRAQQKALEQQVAELENRVKQAIGEAEVAYLPGQDKPAFTWKNEPNNRIDSKRLKAELPEVYAEYLNKKTKRVFRVREN